MTSDRLEWMAVRGAVVLAWLGLSTASWALVLGSELFAQARVDEPVRTVAYLLSRALALSAVLGLGVAVFQVALRALARFGRRGWLLLAAGSCAVAVPQAYALSVFLTEGAWVAELSYVRVVQAALLLLLLGGWLGVWAFHLLGTVPALVPRFVQNPRTARVLHLASWACGLGALALMVVLAPGVLRPYAALVERLLLPAWLVAGTLGFRLHALRPGLARVVSLAVLALAAGSLAFTSLEPDAVSSVRAQALSAGGFAALGELRTHATAHARPGRFDFRRAGRASCPRAERLAQRPSGEGERARRNVILLSVDTVRRDAIGKRYGSRAVAPNLEAFARESVFFERAVAPASITLYSIGSLLTGRSVGQLLWSPAPPANVFARTRRSFDRQLHVLPDWSVMRRSRLTSLITQGTPTQYVARGKDPTRRFIAELEQARERDERVFFWLHMVDPHAPYTVRKRFDFGDTEVDRYYAEVAYADEHVGRVFGRLRQLGYFEDSLIVVFSDHGESLGEGGYFGHGVSMAARFTDVPLYVRWPGVTPRRSRAAVSITSVAATVLHYLDRPIPGSLVGCSLLRPEVELAGCSMPVSTAFGLETRTFDDVLKNPVRSIAGLERRQTQVERWQRFPPEVAITSSEHRYVVDLKTGSERLHDRVRDPRERRDLIAGRPQLVREFRERFEHWQADEAQRIACQLREEKER